MTAAANEKETDLQHLLSNCKETIENQKKNLSDLQQKNYQIHNEKNDMELKHVAQIKKMSKEIESKIIFFYRIIAN